MDATLPEFVDFLRTLGLTDEELRAENMTRAAEAEDAVPHAAKLYESEQPDLVHWECVCGLCGTIPRHSSNPHDRVWMFSCVNAQHLALAIRALRRESTHDCTVHWRDSDCHWQCNCGLYGSVSLDPSKADDLEAIDSAIGPVHDRALQALLKRHGQDVRFIVDRKRLIIPD